MKLHMSEADAQRVWFPEMIGQLRAEWQQGMTFDAIVELRDRMEAMLQRIRKEQGFRADALRCRRCGKVSSGAEPHVSVRSMILSLLRFDIGTAEEVHGLEKAWAAHRKINGLGVFGRHDEDTAVAAACCARPKLHLEANEMK
jgi:hypothetical protein